MEIIDETLSYELESNYIFFIVKGELTLNSALNWWKTILKTAKENGTSSILIEVIFFNDLEYQDLIDLTFEFINLGFKEFKIAYIDSNPENITMNKFAKHAIDLDNLNIKVFDNKVEALNWLISDSKA